MAKVLERGEPLACICLDVRDWIYDTEKDFGANHRPELGGCVYPDQGGVGGSEIIGGGVGGQAGQGGGQGGQGLGLLRNTHHGCAGIRGWVHDRDRQYGSGGSRGGGVRERGNSQQDGNVCHENCGEGARQAVLCRRQVQQVREAITSEPVGPDQDGTGG